MIGTASVLGPSKQRLLSRRAGILFTCVAATLAVAAPAGCGSSSHSSTSASATATRPRPVDVPGSTLSGTGAFMGPVRQVAVNGIKIGYRQFGHGPDLLMVMGETGSMSFWATSLPRKLAAHYRVTMFDNRGVGYTTDEPKRKLSIPLMAEDTAGLIGALRLHAPIVFGWSMGGEIGLTLITTHGSLVGTLVTSGADFGGTHAIQPPAEITAIFDNPNTTPAQLLPYIFPASAAVAQAAYVADLLSVTAEPVSPDIVARQGLAVGEWFHYEGTYDGLPKVTVPVLATNGVDDAGVPAENTRLIVDRLTRSRHKEVVLFAGASHGMMFQDQDKFVTTVLNFAGK